MSIKKRPERKIVFYDTTGNGPVNALDNAIRKALEKFYPQLTDMELVDYKGRVLSAGKGTASKVRGLLSPEIIRTNGEP